MSQGRALNFLLAEGSVLAGVQSLTGKKLRVKATEVPPSLRYTIPSQEP